MKALGLVLIAALAIGCSSTPTSPSISAGTALVAADQDQKPNPGSDTHTIELYFLAHGADSRRPIGMPVSVRSASVDWQDLIVGGSGFVTIVIPAADTWIGTGSTRGTVSAAIPPRFRSPAVPGRTGITR